MLLKDVPQDNNKTYRGYGTKAMYAVDESGKYTTGGSNGWEVEEVVLRDVLDDFAQEAQEARQKFEAGECSPVPYFMNKNYMDSASLAYGVGLPRWRVKRHFRPAVFKKLPEKLLQRYAVFFKTNVANFTTLKDEK